MAWCRDYDSAVSSSSKLIDDKETTPLNVSFSSKRSNAESGLFAYGNSGTPGGNSIGSSAGAADTHTALANYSTFGHGGGSPMFAASDEDEPAEQMEFGRSYNSPFLSTLDRT